VTRRGTDESCRVDTEAIGVADDVSNSQRAGAENALEKDQSSKKGEVGWYSMSDELSPPKEVDADC
jgi:hypothetical protein